MNNVNISAHKLYTFLLLLLTTTVTTEDVDRQKAAEEAHEEKETTRRMKVKIRGATQSTQVHFSSWQHSTFLTQSLCWEQEDEEAEDQNQPLMLPRVPSMVRSQASLSDTTAAMDEVMMIRNSYMGKVVILYLNFSIIVRRRVTVAGWQKFMWCYVFKIYFVCDLLFPFSCFVDFKILRIHKS